MPVRHEIIQPNTTISSPSVEFTESARLTKMAGKAPSRAVITALKSRGKKEFSPLYREMRAEIPMKAAQNSKTWPIYRKTISVLMRLFLIS